MNTLTEKSSQELMVTLISALEYLDKTEEQNDRSLTNCSDDHITDDLLNDPDLLEIQAMSDEAVMTELVDDFGHDPEKICQREETYIDDTVIPFPDRKEKQRQIEVKLETTLLATLIQEAILKKASSTDLKNDTDVSHAIVDQYVSGTKESLNTSVPIPIFPANDHQIDENAERKLRFFKRAFGIAATLLVVSVVSIAVVIDKYEERNTINLAAANVADSVIEPVAHSRNFEPPPPASAMHAVYKVPEPGIVLPYEETIDFLDKIESGEIKATSVEKLRIATKLNQVAKGDSLKVDGYVGSNTCVSSGVYEHVVVSGDNLSNIINSCAYKIADSRFFQTNRTIKINDILTFQVNQDRVITKVSLERESEPLQIMYEYD